jgi:predicted nucleotidyltransferase
MRKRADVDHWLKELVERLHGTFGKRLVAVTHHGSWARGEATPESDIDVRIVLDVAGEEDLDLLRSVIQSMPDAHSLASGILTSVEELRAWPRHELVQWLDGSETLYGSAEGLAEKPRPEDLLEDVRIKVSDVVHAARHYLLFPHDPKVVVHRLYYRFKECFFGMQSWMLLTEGKYYEKKTDLLEVLTDPDDREVIRIAKDWRDLDEDREQRPEYYIRTIERWGRKMMARIREVSV